MLTLQSLQGQFSGFHLLTLSLNVFKMSISYQSYGNNSYNCGPRNETLALPWHFYFTGDLENSPQFISKNLSQLILTIALFC